MEKRKLEGFSEERVKKGMWIYEFAHFTWSKPHSRLVSIARFVVSIVNYQSVFPSRFLSVVDSRTSRSIPSFWLSLKLLHSLSLDSISHLLLIFQTIRNLRTYPRNSFERKWPQLPILSQTLSISLQSQRAWLYRIYSNTLLRSAPSILRFQKFEEREKINLLSWIPLPKELMVHTA